MKPFSCHEITNNAYGIYGVYEEFYPLIESFNFEILRGQVTKKPQKVRLKKLRRQLATLKMLVQDSLASTFAMLHLQTLLEGINILSIEERQKRAKRAKRRRERRKGRSVAIRGCLTTTTITTTEHQASEHNNTETTNTTTTKTSSTVSSRSRHRCNIHINFDADHNIGFGPDTGTDIDTGIDYNTCTDNDTGIHFDIGTDHVADINHSTKQLAWETVCSESKRPNNLWPTLTLAPATSSEPTTRFNLFHDCS